MAVGTRHGKQDQFGPAFSGVLGAHLVTPADLDTDQFGTFSGDVVRRGTAADAAAAKARLAMEVCGLPLGLASEASYGTLPGSGWPGHEEIAVFIDAEMGITVVEGLRSMSVPGSSHTVSDSAEVPRYLLAGLPGQALIVRAEGIEPIKGISDQVALQSAVASVAARSSDGLAIVEPDLRAHHNPTRRAVLITLAERLARRISAECPSCGSPGFGRVDAEYGLPCRFCGTPTPTVKRELHGCPRCSHTTAVPAADGADPAFCPACNP